MARRSYTPERIIKKLREVGILLSQGSTVGEAARKIGATEQTYYRWRREYGGMRIKESFQSVIGVGEKVKLELLKGFLIRE